MSKPVGKVGPLKAYISWFVVKVTKKKQKQKQIINSCSVIQSELNCLTH